MSRDEEPLAWAPTGVLYLGSRIRQLRQMRGLSREQLGERVGRHPASLSKIETNAARPSRILLSKLADALEVSIEEWSVCPLHPRLAKANDQQAVEHPHVVGLASLQRDLAQLASLQREVQRLTARISQQAESQNADIPATPSAGPRLLHTVVPQDVLISESISEVKARAQHGVEGALTSLFARSSRSTYSRESSDMRAALEDADAQPGTRFLWQHGLGEITIPHEVDAERVKRGDAQGLLPLDRQKRAQDILVQRRTRQHHVLNRLRTDSKHHVYDVCPLAALDHLVKTGEPYQGEALCLLGYPAASPSGVRAHLEYVLQLLETYSNYHLALVTEARDVSLCSTFWLVAGSKAVFYEWAVSTEEEEIPVISQVHHAPVVQLVSMTAQALWDGLSTTSRSRCWVKKQLREYLAQVGGEERMYERGAGLRLLRRLPFD